MIDRIKLAAAIAAGALMAGSLYTLLTYPVDAAIPEKTRFYSIGRERSADEVADINALARMLYGEARGVKSTTEKAACVWVVLNRVDDPRWPDTAIEVLSQPWQFGGYSESNPIEDWARTLAADVYDRWQAEKAGADDGKVMRVIPDDYFFWRGSRDGKHNWFRKKYDEYTGEKYSFGIDSPYED